MKPGKRTHSVSCHCHLSMFGGTYRSQRASKQHKVKWTSHPSTHSRMRAFDFIIKRMLIQNCKNVLIKIVSLYICDLKFTEMKTGLISFYGIHIENINLIVITVINEYISIPVLFCFLLLLFFAFTQTMHLEANIASESCAFFTSVFCCVYYADDYLSRNVETEITLMQS